jgi:hypothetical protein
MSARASTRTRRGSGTRAFCRHVGPGHGPTCAAQYRTDRTASAITLQDRREATTARWESADIRQLKRRHTWTKEDAP